MKKDVRIDLSDLVGSYSVEESKNISKEIKKRIMKAKNKIEKIKKIPKQGYIFIGKDKTEVQLQAYEYAMDNFAEKEALIYHVSTKDLAFQLISKNFAPDLIFVHQLELKSTLDLFTKLLNEGWILDHQQSGVYLDVHPSIIIIFEENEKMLKLISDEKLMVNYKVFRV